ncbi:IS21 family transposase [Actinomadura sp. 3N508]|uniref:IS21 family transposase n=1 Tax=Actinomadura sp. 3N508 TaxID=3375153 RepID=UPI0037A9E582
MSLTKQELFRSIRHDSWREGLSVRALARKYGVHRRLVREALATPVPAPRRTPQRSTPQMGAFTKTIDEWLRADLEAPPKQRHTARRITARLAEEFAVQIPYPTVRDHVRKRRTVVATEAAAPAEGFIVRHNRPGYDAEVDFGEVWVRLDGQMTKCFLFAFRMAYSGRAVHRISSSCGQQAFLAGHVHAFTTLGGVPAGQIRYDNLSAAVSRVIYRSRSRQESPRWREFQTHYGFTPFYCQPGERGAHEKGGVEGQIGYFRRNYLTPVPEVGALTELNARLLAFERKEDQRRIGHRIRTIGQDFELEAAVLLPLPAEPFGTGLTFTPRVDRYSLITVKMCRYSVPVHLIGRKVHVVLHPEELLVYDGRRQVAQHPRLSGRGAERIVLDHYLEVLLTKPGALAGSEALDQARRQGVFTAVHEALWAQATGRLGETEGTKTLVQVLLLHRHLHGDDVLAGISRCLHSGTVSIDAISLEARKSAEAHGRSPTVTSELEPPPPAVQADQSAVTSLDEHRRALLHDTRPPPRLENWDQLLHRTRKSARKEGPR